MPRNNAANVFLSKNLWTKLRTNLEAVEMERLRAAWHTRATFVRSFRSMQAVGLRKQVYFGKDFKKNESWDAKTKWAATEYTFSHARSRTLQFTSNQRAFSDLTASQRQEMMRCILEMPMPKLVPSMVSTVRAPPFSRSICESCERQVLCITSAFFLCGDNFLSFLFSENTLQVQHVKMPLILTKTHALHFASLVHIMKDYFWMCMFSSKVYDGSLTYMHAYIIGMYVCTLTGMYTHAHVRTD
jgi:hypothetical protein